MQIQVTLLYFAQAREDAGTGEELFFLPSGSSVLSLLERASEKHPRLRRMRRNLQFALNEEIARGDETLKDGDTVALIPPVAGG